MAASAKALKNSSPADAVSAALARHLPRGASVTVALSGGIDSVVLFHCVLACRDELGLRLGCLHVHHGLSPNAEAWADFCDALCRRHGVPFERHHVAVAADDPAGIEAAARSARRRVLAAIEADAVLTAHHLDDQAETILLQLLRGAGPRGLAAMAAWHRPAGWHAAQLRPLLEVPRRAIHAWAVAQGLTWVEDESNADPRYRRNALRHEVMPAIARHFPGHVANLARASALQGEAAALLADLAAIDAATAVCGEWLDCAALARLDSRRQRNLLRHFILGRGCRLPPERRLEQARRQLLEARADAEVCVDLGGYELHRFRGRACLLPTAPAEAPRAVAWCGEAALELPWLGQTLCFTPATGAGLKRSLLQAGPVEVRVRRGGEHLRPHPGGARRSLKKLLQEAALPPWERARLPLLFCGGRLAWAAGIGYEAECLASAGEPGIILALQGQQQVSSHSEPIA